MAKSLDYYLNKTKAEAAPASASPVQKTETNKKDLTYYLNKSTPTYGSALGQQKGLYAQAVEDNRNAKFGEKLRGIAGGSLRGAAQTYAADLENAGATLDQTLAEINERNPFVKRLPEDVQKAWTEEIAQLRRDAEAMQKQSDELSRKGSANIEKAKSYTGKVGDLLIDTGVAVGQMGVDALATAMVPGAGTALMASRVYGGNARTAREEGANLLQQNLYGLGGAAAAVGIGKLAGGAMGAYGGGATDDFIETLAGKASGKEGKNIIRAVLKSQGEGIEEGLEALLDPALKAIYKGRIGQNYRDMDWQEVLQNYLVGVLSGGAAEAVSMTTGSYKAANAILEDPEVQQAVETYWRREAENGALNKETREAFRQAASEMATAREVMTIARAAGIDTEAARALVEAKKAGNTETKKTVQKAAQAATEAENGVINEENISDEGQGNGLDGIGARGQIGIFPEAAGEPDARISGDQSEAGRGRENSESADLREVNPEELGITGAQNTVMLIDPERAGGSIADAADTVRSAGMEPVAFRGELRVGNASVNGYIEDGRIFFRTDAVDNRGREITAEQIVEHELFHAAAESDPQLVEDVKEVVRERMTEAEFDTMMADYAVAYSKVQDFSGWTPEQIAEYLYQEIAADAYAGLNYFNDAPETVEDAKAAAPQVGQARADRSRAETRGPTMENETAPSEDGAGRAAISVDFSEDFNKWLENGKPNERRLFVGTTSEPLQSIGIDSKKIFWDTSKINKIQRDHPEMSDEVLSQVPDILERPIIVMESKTQPNRVTIFGEVYADNGLPVMAVLELLPTGKRSHEINAIKVANAYTKAKDGMPATVQGTQGVIDNSTILYIDPNKNRTNGWLSHNQLQLPFGITNFGSIAKVSLVPRDVKGNFTANSKSQEVPEWKKKLQEYNGKASVEVEEPQQTPEERELAREGTVWLNRDGKRVDVEIRRATTGQWFFSVRAVGGRPVYDETPYTTAQEVARAAMQIAEQYTIPERTRAQRAINKAADEAIETPPPIGRFTKAERDLEEDRLRTLVEDVPWGAGSITLSQDQEEAAAAETFADERAEKQAAEDMADAMEDYRELLRGQMPVRSETADQKVTAELKAKKEPRNVRIREGWRSAVRAIVNAGDTIHRIARETGNKALDGYYFRALAARQAGTEWIAGKRHDIMGRQTGQGLNEIFNPIRAKGQEYYEQFQMYLYHQLNIDRMSRDYEKDAREAQAEVDRLLRVEPGLANLSATRLQQIANGYSMDAELAKDYLEAVGRRNAAEKKGPKPVFGFDVTADDSRAAVERLIEKHPEFAELAQSVYDYSNDLLQYRVDAGLIQQKDKDFLQRLYPHYVPTFRATAEERARILHKGGLSVSKAIGRATGSNDVLLPLHVSLARQAMTVTKNGTINRLGNALLETRDADKEAMSPYIMEVKEAESGFSEDSFDEEETLEPRQENVITIIENGKRYDLTLDKGLTEAFKAFEPDAWGDMAIFQASKGMVDLFKKLVTAYNPLFVIRNALRDVQDAGLYSVDSKEWAKNFPRAYQQIKNDGKYWQMYKGLGGNYASFFDYATGEVRAENAGIVGKIEMVNRWVEAAPRLAEFMTVIQKAEARGEVTEADLMEAFEAAQDVTTNFGRAGSFGKLANKYLVPFLNPSIQGADKFIRTLTEGKSAKAWAALAVKAAALGIVPTILNALLYRDDEEWDDISDANKANNYLFKGRDGVWIKIPKGRAIATLSAGAVAAAEALRGDELDPREYLDIIATNVAPQNPMEANIFKAWFDADLFQADSKGQTWYGGTIETERMQSYRPGERYDESTDVVSKWIGDKLDLSPAKINYLIDQYSGVVGDMLLPLLTPQAERDPLSKAFTIDTVTNNETTGEYYDQMDELKWDMNSGDIAGGTTYRYMSHANSAVSEYYSKIREIEADPELTNREKKELTRELYRDLVEYQKEIMDTAEKYRMAAEDYYDEHPELDHEDPAAVKAYMERYNAQQTTEEYYKNADQTKDLMEAIVYREVNREVLGAEYALETYSDSVYERAVEVNRSAAVSYDTYYDYYFGTKDMHADRDENGKSISGTKKAKVLGFIADMEISDEQKDALAIDAGYKAGSWKSYADGKSGGGSGGRGRSKKAKAVKVKNTLTKPVGISYNRSMSIAARTTKDTSAYEDIQKATSKLRKKNPWYELPTGNPELDEERPAAARYFKTGKL